MYSDDCSTYWIGQFLEQDLPSADWPSPEFLNTFNNYSEPRSIIQPRQAEIHPIPLALHHITPAGPPPFDGQIPVEDTSTPDILYYMKNNGGKLPCLNGFASEDDDSQCVLIIF